MSLLTRLKERKLVQWALAYAAGAWVIFEVSDAVGGRWQLPDVLYQGLSVVLVVGFFVTLVLAWYHGEKGRQRVSGPELLMLTTLFAVSALGLSLVARPSQDAASEVAGTEAGENAAETLRQLPGIAVLPFVNSSGVAEDQSWTDSTTSFSRGFSGRRVSG